MLAIPRPDRSEYADYYASYVACVPDGDVLDHLARQADRTQAVLARVGEERAGHRYAPGKWCVKQVAGHMADTERLFTFRALAFARGDRGPLPSMDQDLWAAGAGFEARTLASIAAELRAVRAATLAMFGSFGPEVLSRTGVASGNTFTVRSLVWITAGHELYHLRVLAERYDVR